MSSDVKVKGREIMSDREARLWIAGALMVGLSVMLGAFGAHAVKQRVDSVALGWWETAADYHRAHGLALLVLAALYPRVSEAAQKHLGRAGWCFILGIALFSGSLYTMTLTQIRALGMITPIGGTLWLIGWGLFAWGIFVRSSTSDRYASPPET